MEDKLLLELLEANYEQARNRFAKNEHSHEDLTVIILKHQTNHIAHLDADLRNAIVVLDGRVDALDKKIDTSFAVLDKKIDESVARLDKKIDESAARLDEKIDTSFAVLDKKIDTSFAVLDKKIDTSISNLDRDLRKDIRSAISHQTMVFLGAMAIFTAIVIAVVKL